MSDYELNDRVRRNTSSSLNKQIDNRIRANVMRFIDASPEEITKHIKALDREWDIERYIEVNAPIFAGTGLILGLIFSPYWFILSFAVLGFLALHGIQGWCPPVPLFRWFGVRTQKEIELERQILKYLRGDFRDLDSRWKQIDIDSIIDSVCCSESASSDIHEAERSSIFENATY